LLEFLDSFHVKGALEHREEGRRQKQAYDRATPEERARVLGHAVDEIEVDAVGREMYGEEWGELEREQADIIRKRQKEEGR
jgi:hypothetical protein